MKSIKEPEYVMQNATCSTSSKLNQTFFTSSGSPDSDEDEYEDECDFPFTNFNSQIEVELVPSTPQTKHLIVGSGVNIKARCANKDCTANNFQSKCCWIKKGFGSFDIARQRYKNFCVCGTRVSADSIKTIGFTNAEIKVTGLKIVNDEGVDFCQSYIEDKGKFIYFDDIDSTMSMWASLHIEAKQLQKH